MIAELFRYFGFSQSLQDENDHLRAMLRDRENTIDCMAAAYRDKEKELKKSREDCDVWKKSVRDCEPTILRLNNQIIAYEDAIRKIASISNDVRCDRKQETI